MGTDRADYLIFLWGMETAHVADYLLGADQKTTDQLVKMTFLGRLKLQLGSVLSPSWWYGLA